MKFTIPNKCQTYVPGNVLIEGQCKPSQKTHRSSWQFHVAHHICLCNSCSVTRCNYLKQKQSSRNSFFLSSYFSFYGSPKEDRSPSHGITNTFTVSWTKKSTFTVRKFRKIHRSRNLHQLTPGHFVIRVKWLEITEFL